MDRSPRLYRKKPVIVEAIGPLSYDNAASVAMWCGGKVSRALDCVAIPTLEGVMTASLGDYIIRGVQGEFYPCRNDIFQATYEPVSDDGLLVCDRCGELWRVAEVCPDLPCCPVPLCDECADLHRREVAQESEESNG